MTAQQPPTAAGPPGGVPGQPAPTRPTVRAGRLLPPPRAAAVRGTAAAPRPAAPSSPVAAAGARRAEAPAATRRWRPGWPLDLGLVLGRLQRGSGDPALRPGPDGSLWRASRTPAGPGTLRVRALPREGAVEGQAWGPGAQWLLEGLPALLGADDRPEAFLPRHRVVHQARHRNPGLRLGRTGLVLESLVPAVLEQRVTTGEAYRAWRQILYRHGEPAPGPQDSPAARMRVMPEPRAWALIPSWEWHRFGVDGQRSSTVLRVVRLARRLEEAAVMDGESASRRLQLVPGVGPWTAAEALQRSNGAADLVSVGDLHLPGTVGWALAGERDADDARMLELLEPYRGQRHRACRYILLSGRTPPRRGPRCAPLDIRRI